MTVLYVTFALLYIRANNSIFLNIPVLIKQNSEQFVLEDTEKAFENLICMVKERCSELKEVIQTQKRTELSQARTLVDQLHQDVAELQKSDSDIAQLSQTEDHLDFLQV